MRNSHCITRWRAKRPNLLIFGWFWSILVESWLFSRRSSFYIGILNKIIVFFRKIALTFASDRIFGRDFFLTNAPCDFLSTEHVFEWILTFRKKVWLWAYISITPAYVLEYLNNYLHMVPRWMELYRYFLEKKVLQNDVLWLCLK